MYSFCFNCTATALLFSIPVQFLGPSVPNDGREGKLLGYILSLPAALCFLKEKQACIQTF